MADPTQPPEQRIGDRERAEIDARLRTAQADGALTLVEYDERAAACYAARFRSDLDPLVADLPPADPGPAAPGPGPAATTAGPAPSPTTAGGAPAPVVHRDRHPSRHGRWRRLVPLAVVAAVVVVVGPGVLGAGQGAAVFGSRTVQVAPGQESVDVGVLFGSVDVVVPDGTPATGSGTVVFGGVDCDQACASAPGAPTVRPVEVRAHGAFGSVDVVTASQAARGEEPDDDD